MNHICATTVDKKSTQEDFMGWFAEEAAENINDTVC